MPVPIKILIADDEAEIVESCEMLLREKGYEVVSALDGVQTVEMAREHHPDVVILDINMPKKSGEQVLRELLAIGSKTKVIISTGQAGMDRSMKDRIIKNFPVSAFLEKPTGIEEMDYVIREILKGP